MRRRIGAKALDIAIVVIFFIVMTTLVLPWAINSMADSFVQPIEVE